MHAVCSVFFFFNDTATTEIYTLSLHDALPIFRPRGLEHAHSQPPVSTSIGRSTSSQARGSTSAASSMTTPSAVWPRADRKSVVLGKSVDLGGRRIIKKKKTKIGNTSTSYPQEP